jgi:hypothetical protein
MFGSFGPGKYEVMICTGEERLDTVSAGDDVCVQQAVLMTAMEAGW